jgi:HSP20 family protein
MEASMASHQELQVQQKREVEKKQERTAPSRSFLPVTDIYESDQALTVVLEMPGVAKQDIAIKVEDDVVTIEGRIDYSKYKGLMPVYTEYNIGNYLRSFSSQARSIRAASPPRSRTAS